MEPKPLTDEEAESCLAKPDESTQDFLFQQTMYRIKDPKASLKFYSEVLGMRLLKKIDMAAMKFTVYFMGYEKAEDIPKDPSERTEWALGRKATLELTHNWGTENDPDCKYHNGNSDPRGFGILTLDENRRKVMSLMKGHIGIMVPDVYKACERFEKLGVKFIKTPDGGKMKGLAFIQDPDGYWIEIFNNKATKDLILNS